MDTSSFTARVIMKAAYGIDIESQDDRYVQIAEKGAEGFSASVNAGSYLVDYIPICESCNLSISLKLMFIYPCSEISSDVVPWC